MYSKATARSPWSFLSPIQFSTILYLGAMLSAPEHLSAGLSPHAQAAVGTPGSVTCRSQHFWITELGSSWVCTYCFSPGCGGGRINLVFPALPSTSSTQSPQNGEWSRVRDSQEKEATEPQSSWQGLPLGAHPCAPDGLWASSLPPSLPPAPATLLFFPFLFEHWAVSAEIWTLPKCFGDRTERKQKRQQISRGRGGHISSSSGSWREQETGEKQDSPPLQLASHLIREKPV